MSDYEAIVIGTSAGGFVAVETLVKSFPSTSRLPIIVVQHLHPNSRNYFTTYLQQFTKLLVKEADSDERISPNTIYFAPPNFHLQIEMNKRFSLSIDAKVHYSRPAIDVLFETAALAYQEKLIGVILTGANNDGSEGIKSIKRAKGLTIAQEPQSAFASTMPQSAIETGCIDHILALEGIGHFLRPYMIRGSVR